MSIIGRKGDTNMTIDIANLKLKPLEGSPKQVAWANEIRTAVHAHFTKVAAEDGWMILTNSRFQLPLLEDGEALAAILDVTDASYWITRRSYGMWAWVQNAVDKALKMGKKK